MAAFLDLADPAFDVTSVVVHQAREQDWYAVTPYGWAVLRYAEGTAVLGGGRFQQGNARWPAQNGVPDGPFAQWWGETLLVSKAPTTSACANCLARRSAAGPLRPCGHSSRPSRTT